MLTIELCRAISADRQRQVDRAMHRRRQMEYLAIGAPERIDSELRSSDRDRCEPAPGARAFGQVG